ncbi:MAG: hypothetical protein IPN98_11180 [Propionivibrio sp.]|nr:hypothetical protein [Propionivibrio sp.]
MVNARFAVMCAHYLFDADFCNVASGWERKASSRRTCKTVGGVSGWMHRIGSFARFTELNLWLGERCRSL